MELNELLEYEFNGAKCYFNGSKPELEAHIKELKKRRDKSANVVDLSGVVKNNTAFPQTHNERIRKS